MAWSHKLHNCTHKDVEIEWHAGIVILVPADGHYILSTTQMEQFIPGSPGAEEIIRMLRDIGCFVEDSDRDFDAQCLEALRHVILSKNRRFNDAVDTMQSMAAAANVESDPNSTNFKTKLKNAGLTRLREDAVILEKRAKMYSQIVTEEDITHRVHVFDPERTIFCMDPPREFPSKMALAVFLQENPEILVEHTKDQAKLELMREQEKIADATVTA